VVQAGTPQAFSYPERPRSWLNAEVQAPSEIAAQPSHCPATKDFASELTLAEAVDLTLCNNPHLRSTWSAVLAQVGNVGQARAAYQPTLTAAFNAMQTQAAYPDAGRFGNSETLTQGDTTQFNMSWRIADWGTRSASLESAEQLLNALAASHDAGLQKAIDTAIRAYSDAQTAQATRDTKKANAATSEETLRVVERRLVHGASSRGDVLQAQAAHAKAELEHSRAEGNFQKARSVLVYTMGVPAEAPVQLAREIPSEEALNLDSLQPWLDQAERSHPDIRAAYAQWLSAKSRATSVIAEGYPTLDFNASYSRNGIPNQTYIGTKSEVTNLGITLNVPLYDGFGLRHKGLTALAQADQREAEWADTRNNALMEVVKAHADALSARNNLQQCTRLLDASQASLASARRRFDNGAADLTELLNAQTALADAHEEKTRCTWEWRAAQTRLHASVGLVKR
jgi:outer membrane protein